MTRDFVWRPSPAYVEGSNLQRFMRRHDIPTYEELVRRSVADVAWFWEAVEDDLGIEWSQPYDTVLDVSRGIEFPAWFLGGRVNITRNCVDRHAEGPLAGRTALVWEGEDGAVRSVGYRELAAEVSRLAAGLRSLGVSKGDRVGVYMPMTIEAVVAMFAVAKLGAVYLPIFSGFGPAAVAARLQDAEAVALISADGFYRRGRVIGMKELSDEAAELAGVGTTVIHRRIGREVPWRDSRDVWWHELVQGQPDDLPCEDTDAEDVWMIAYTSGTTGRPKGSVHVHGGFLVKIASEVAYQTDLRADDVLYWITDMGWIMGQFEAVGGLALGGTVLLYEGAPDHPGPDRVWDLCERHGVTTLGISPTLVRALMPRGTGPVEAHDLSKLRILASTGEPWNRDPWLWLFEHVGAGRCPIVNLSGGTEIAACLLSCYPIADIKPETLRGPSLGMDVDVVDAEGRPVRGGVGELVCRQPWPSMTRGIWGDSDRYLAAYWSRIPGVWCHGDWASIDEDGFWFLHGRSDDTLNIAGKRIGPAEIESVLVGHPAVVEAAAVGVPHPIKGEVVWCFCILTEPEPVTPPTDSEPAGAGRADAGPAAAGDGAIPAEGMGAGRAEAGEAVQIPAEGVDLRQVRGAGVDPGQVAVELEALVDQEIGKVFRPDRIVFVPDLPRTRSAKILRRAVRATAIGQDPGDLSSLENPTALDGIAAALAAGSGTPRASAAGQSAQPPL